MKKITALFAALIATLPVLAADWCSLRAVASQYDDQVCFEIVPKIEWDKTDAKSYDLLFAVYFYDEWMNALKSDDKLYEAANGQVAANAPYLLSNDDANPNVNICIPVAQLHLSAGQNKMYYTVEVFNHTAGTYESLASTSPHLFELNPGDTVVIEPVKKEKVKDKTLKKTKEEKAISQTFKRSYRNVWDEDMCEEIRFYENGTVELIHIFKGYDENLKKSGTYILKKVESTPRINVIIDWNRGGSEKNWYLQGSSHDHSLFNGKQEWKPVK